MPCMGGSMGGGKVVTFAAANSRCIQNNNVCWWSKEGYDTLNRVQKATKCRYQV